MSECIHNCKKCDGCGGEHVILSGDKTASFVSTLTFPLRNLENKKLIFLNVEIKNINGVKNSAFASIEFFDKSGRKIEVKSEKYEIVSTEYEKKSFSFAVVDNASRANITLECFGDCILDILHVNTSCE